MPYEGTVIRPPSEAFSIILQVTVGCSYNKCTFCGAFKDKRFRVKTDEEIDDDLRLRPNTAGARIASSSPTAMSSSCHNTVCRRCSAGSARLCRG